MTLSRVGATAGFIGTLARDLRQHGGTDLARPAIVKLWKSGVRTPYLTTTYAATTKPPAAPHNTRPAHRSRFLQP